MIFLLSKSLQKTIWAKWVAFSSPVMIRRPGRFWKKWNTPMRILWKPMIHPMLASFQISDLSWRKLGLNATSFLTPARERPARRRRAGLPTEPSDQDWEKANKPLLWPWAGDERFQGIHMSYCIRKIPHVSYISLPSHSQAKVVYLH